MKVLIIKSRSSEHVLAEIRTDGRLVEFIVDNTSGRLPKMIGKDYQKLTKLLSESSLFYAESPKVATAHLVRYVLDNGDVAEITTDGRTCLLNGRLLSDEEKVSLFNSIRNGDLKVAHKADRERPVPVVPAQTPIPVQEPDNGMDRNITSEFSKMIAEKDELAKDSDSSYDHEIENLDLSDAEDAEYSKRLMYLLKYGEKRG